MEVRPRCRGSVAATLAWALLLVVALVWGQHLLPGGELNSKAPPFLGQYRFSLRAAVPGAVVLALGLAVLPVLARRLAWPLLLPVGAAVAALWAVALAVWDGHRSLGSPISRPHEYLPALAAVGDDPVAFLTRFAEDAANRRLPVHVNGHPPLMVLVFWALGRTGLDGEGWAAALVIAAGSSAVAAIALTLREVGDEAAARRSLPFLVLAPFAITVATSADAFFLGVAAWSAAMLAVGMRRSSWPALLASGLLAGALPYLSYGLLPFGAVLVAVGWLSYRRHGWPGGTAPSRRLLAVAWTLGAAAVPVALTAGGFWWFDGVVATHRAWELGKGDDRPYGYSLLADFAVLGVLVGPATVVGATRGPGRAPAVLAGAGLVAVLSLAVSGVTRLEVERIWLPFAPWLVVLTAALAGGSRRWLVVNGLCALAFQVLVRDVW